MKRLLYIIAVILILLWAIGSFAYHIGSAFIHLLLIVAIVFIIFNIIRGKRHN